MHISRSFDCFQCGLCCGSFRIQLILPEAQTIAKKLKLSWQDFYNGYLDNYYVATDRFLLRQINGKCIFLKSEDNLRSLCTIHTFKPESCAEWKANLEHPECRNGLKVYWGLQVDEKGQIRGDVEQISRFDAFLKSLG